MTAKLAKGKLIEGKRSILIFIEIGMTAHRSKGTNFYF